MSSALSTTRGGTPLAVSTFALLKRYGKTLALGGVDLSVPEGSVYMLAGQNGAGKSTLLQILLNLVRPDSGWAQVFGLDSRRDGPIVRAQIGYVPERHDWGMRHLKIDYCLRYHAVFYPTWDWAYAEQLVRRYGVSVDRYIDKVSKGEARRVQLIMALAHRPPLLLLDEPTDGLDPLARDETLSILAEHLAETPTTVLVSTHHAGELEGLADHIGVLKEGELQVQVRLEDLHRKLLRYRAEVPEGWQGVPGLNGAVLRRAGSRREILWTIWGDEADILRRLAATGATVRETSSLSLDNAVVTLLAGKDE